MENEEKKVAKKVVADEKVEISKSFKNRYILTDEELKSLPKARIKLAKSVSNQGREFFNVNVAFGPATVISQNITRSKFNLACLENELSERELSRKDTFLSLDVPVRYSTGISPKNQKKFYTYELMISKSARLLFFFADDELKELELIKKVPEFVDRVYIEEESDSAEYLPF